MWIHTFFLACMVVFIAFEHSGMTRNLYITLLEMKTYEESQTIAV